MKKFSRKILSVLLVIALFVPTGAMMVTINAETESIEIGEKITLGMYNGSPINWICVDIDENGPLMLAEDVLCQKEFDAAGESSIYHTDGWGYIRERYGSSCWYDSNIRQWLNSNEISVSWSHCPPSYSEESGFLTNFSESELSYIKTVSNLYNVNIWESKRDGYCDGGNTDSIPDLYKISFNPKNCYYKNIEDKIFLITAVQFNRIYNSNEEYIEASNDYFTSIIHGNNYACYEHICTVNANSTDLESSTSAYLKSGIRPAFYLNLDKYNNENESSNMQNLNVNIHEDLVFLDVGESYQFSAYDADGMDITDSLTWQSSNASVAEIVSPGYVRAKSRGLITVSAEKSYKERDYCYIYVGDPNHIEYSTIYDTDYYYNGDGFYSNAAQISNAVDVYLSLENCIADEMQSMYDKDALLGTYEEEFNSLAVGEFTVTATVSGNDLSFSKDSYSNTYSETFSNIPIETIVDDILVLYPYELTVSGNKKSYTVNVKIESDDFETIEDTITFSVSDLASKAANEHIDYLNTNLTYKTSLHNSYGTNMVKLKDDEEYKFSKYSTFDFDNYYEIVVGDLLIDFLNVHHTGNISLLPKVVTEYNSVINSVISTINTIVYDDYGEALDISETAIDKFIKTSKYRDDGVYAENIIFQAIQKTCGNTANAEKINKVFAAADKTKQVCKFLNFGLDTINSIIDFTNRISVFNAYNDASNSFKAVFEKLYESIPTSETKMREAVRDYINYADNGFTMTAEIIEAYGDLSKKVGTDAITTYLGKSFMDLTSGMVCEWIGSITLSSGATFASTAAFATVQAAFGGFLTGAAIGLCLSDLCCNSSEKAAEMGKIIAMSEYTPYIIEMVQYYENNLRTNKNDYAVELFEHAFALHKVSQVYIIGHTIKALEIKRDSIIENLFDREGEYEQVITDTLSIKSQLENMFCHSNDTTASIVRRTKVIAIKCPVDVLVYDENGNLVVEIRDNTLVYCADGIEVCISESQKYICVPAENEYEVKVVSIGEGKMDYIVFEYDEKSKLESKKKIDSIPLSIGKELNGTIYETSDGSENCIYSLKSGEDEYFTEEDNCTIQNHVTSLINYEKSSCTNEGYSGDVYCEDCKKIIEYGEVITVNGHLYSETIISPTCTEDGYVLYCCASCGDSYVDDYVNATGHTEEVIPAKSAACTETGLTEGKKCSVCGEILVAQTEIPATGHDYVAVVTAPTCTEKGFTTYTCSCGETYVDSYVDALGHKEEILPGKSATCTETGISEGKKCSVCGEVFLAQKEIPAKGHTPGNWEVVKAAEIGKEGKELQKCTVCGEVLDERVIPALPDVSYMTGDANGDGKITAADARIALRISAKVDSLEKYNLTAEVLDVTGDGKLTAADARKILRIAAKIE